MMLTAASVAYRSVRGMLRNCLFPVQFPECWDVDRHAEMDVVSVGGGVECARGGKAGLSVELQDIRFFLTLFISNQNYSDSIS
jgi:hypothetical protein